MFKHLRAHRDKVSASQYNKLVDVVDNLAIGLAHFGIIGSDGTLMIRTPLAKPTPKLYEVQSEATGDGVYNCYEQVFDSTDWDATDGTEKHTGKNTDSIEILNLAECDPEATYVAQIAANDLIWAWSILDDEAVPRFVGVPFRIGAHRAGVRQAWCSAAAGAGSTIAATLDSTSGAAITVTCRIVNGTALNSAIPRLEDNDEIFVVKIAGTWYCTTVFQTSEDCNCG